MIKIEMIGDRELVARLEALPEKARAGVARAIARLGFNLQRRVQEKLAGDVLKVKSGALRASIGLRTEDSGARVSAIVGTGAVFYAGFHEYGVPKSWIIEAKTAKALKFGVGIGRAEDLYGYGAASSPIFRRQVTHPPLPERSFARTALREIEPEVGPAIEAELAAAAAAA